MEPRRKAEFVIISVQILLMATLSNACVCLPPKHPQEHFCQSDFVIRAYVQSRTEDKSTYTAVYHVQILDILKHPENSSLFRQKEFSTTSRPLTESEETNKTSPDTYTRQAYSLGDILIRDNNRTTAVTADHGMSTSKVAPTETVQAALHTSMWGSLCGVYLNLRSTYIVGGHVVNELPFIDLCGLHIMDDSKSLNKRQRAGFFRKYRDSCDCTIRYCNGWRCPVDSVDQCSVNPDLSFEDFMDCANRYSMCRRRNGKCQWTKNSKHKSCQNRALRKRYRMN